MMRISRHDNFRIFRGAAPTASGGVEWLCGHVGAMFLMLVLLFPRVG